MYLAAWQAKARFTQTRWGRRRWCGRLHDWWSRVGRTTVQYAHQKAL